MKKTKNVDQRKNASISAIIQTTKRQKQAKSPSANWPAKIVKTIIKENIFSPFYFHDYYTTKKRKKILKSYTSSLNKSPLGIFST
jgi:hypothetical protein